MANIHDCIQRAVDAGELDQVRANEAKSEFDQLVERYANAMPIHAAEATAAIHLKKATQNARRSRKHAVLNQLQGMVRLKHLIEDADDPAKALLALLEPLANDGFRGESVEFMAQAIQARVRFDLKDMLKDVGTNVIGNSKDPAKLKDVIREAHGQSTGSAIAKAYADAIRHVQKWQRQMFNAHGGDIGEIADYGLRHSHDAELIKKAGFAKWSREIFDDLDWSRITNRQTGEPFSASGAKPDFDSVEPMLSEVFDNITTGGWNNREPSMGVGGKALYNQRAEPRILHFSDGDAWLRYNASYGTSDPFTALIGGLDAMARDIAHMKVLTGNPNSGLEYAIQVATKKAHLSGDPKMASRVETHAKRARVLLAHTTGAINSPESAAFARAASNLRHFNVATRLGSAVLSSVTDLQTMSVGAMAMKMNPGNFLATAVRNLVSAASVQDAARMGFTVDTLMDMHVSSARLTNDVVAGDVFSRMSSFTIRASGLSYWTDRMRLAVQQETAGHLASQADKALDDVQPMLRGLLERSGITGQDWDHLRAPEAMFQAKNGATFMSPLWWLEHQTSLPRGEAEALALRLQGAFQDQLETFVPSKRMRGSAAVLGETKPGTFMGELARSTAGFKNYAVSLTMGQIALFQSLPTPRSKATYLGAMALGSVIMGALAIQLKSLAGGNDPRPMDSGKFWLAAALQGGGLGIFGDFLFSESNRFGGGLAQTLAGPSVGFLGDVINMPMSNINQAIEGNDTYLGRDAANFVRQNTPFASSGWYTRLAFDRLVADQLQSFLDPDAEAQWKRQMRQRERDYGTRSFWQRGAGAPDRLPDISNAMGSTP